MKTKKLIFQLHKILGLATGIIVFIVAITGCCWAFREEIESLYDDYKTVTPEETAIITVTKAKEIALTVFPENTVHGTLFKKKTDAVEVIFYDAEPEFYQSVFINPYSGKIIQVDNHTTGFFAFILKGHMRVWLPKEIGEQVVGASILIFVLIIISGFILWIPKKRKNLKQRLKFDWKKTTKWKRKNFDLHTVTGFYICSLALVIAFTGSIMSYNWLKYVVYKSTGGKKEVFFEIPKNIDSIAISNTTKPIDLLIPILQKESPNAEGFELHYPKDKEESIYVEVSNSKGLFYDSDFRFFDQNSLKEIASEAIYGKYKNATIPDKILRMNYDIHIGAIGGITGKIIAFIISLLTATLPVTGILLWYGRKYKKKPVVKS
ncbi:MULTISPECIES: PepSY-associated TM helix domain-containing protein [Tenacibaculum]|uniref:PepSY-associated TM helix domain-containing protein n=1 Tax=Tenacibaculum TaxID=104267 RepID=UPI001F0A6C2F|nr:MULTISPECIES: PepSY-associated TM helix domain-containing protein [Tenacibaculum]MCH3881830.1 PepSY domain-containing protein [Tenacibaculum aquimarinum]MDO6598601.1 PepSY-associated TM helix domain-containing protein [Tenacibaculum sp. 1_MG-2023]